MLEVRAWLLGAHGQPESLRDPGRGSVLACALADRCSVSLALLSSPRSSRRTFPGCRWESRYVNPGGAVARDDDGLRGGCEGDEAIVARVRRTHGVRAIRIFAFYSPKTKNFHELSSLFRSYVFRQLRVGECTFELREEERRQQR